ncbi:Yip1 family protein [Ectobacillus ponti]|uniref:YIP1 family protein n=1 Tax=Ectobacillus ponti TaxID=2961894 RepID=A0AA42BPP1_9BACI|nr:Yip1 family protein [Ectobacillus ponti]MCP8967719.1 YIP1 family protein [Ectobacillus ponti]
MEVQMEKVKLPKPSLAGMLLSPAVQFERMRRNPRVLGPMFIMAILLSVMLGAFMYLIVNDALIAQIKSAVPDQTIDKATFQTIMGVTGAVIGLIASPIIFLIGGAILKICTTLAGSDATYKQMLSLTIYSSTVVIVYYAVNNILFAVVGYREGMTSFTSLGSLFPSGSMLAGLGSVFDIFYLWSFYLLFAGLQTVAGLKRKGAWIVVGILFGITVLVSVGSTLAQSAA